MSPRESRKRSPHSSAPQYDNHYDDYNQYGDEYIEDSDGKDKKNKTPDDLFEKHSRKFRR